MPSLNRPLIELEVLALAILAVIEFASLWRWRGRIHRAGPRQRLSMVFFTISDLLVGGGLVVLFPILYESSWLVLFEEMPGLIGLILVIALLLLTAGIGKALLLLFVRSRVAPSVANPPPSDLDP
jgi:hypothetical protein